MNTKDDNLTQKKPAKPRPLKLLRIWPAALLLIGMIVTRLAPSLIENGPPGIWIVAAFGPAFCAILVLLWWLALSRATWIERLVGVFGTILVVAATLLLIDKSMLGPAVTVLTIPMGMAGFAIGAILCCRMYSFRRTVVAIILATLGFGYSTLVRSTGFWGNFSLALQWRWVPPSDEMLLREADRRQADHVDLAALKAALANPEWPGFRGPNRDGIQHGPKIATDWKVNPPEPLWKIVVGPGWSSFAVAGHWLFTQEQRGPRETVVCYDGDTGLEVWTHEIESRFDDPLGGPGPRATPTLADGGLFVMGAKGNLARLDPATGDVVWESDLRKVAEREPPTWGFASSPLVVGTSVIVYAGGKGDKGILAFDINTGDLRWSAPAGDQSYSSPQLAKVDGEQFVLYLSNAGLEFVDPKTGDSRLRYKWVNPMYCALQPQSFGQDSVVIPSSMGQGTRRIRVTKDAEGLTAEELWTSLDLKPEFNDLVILDGNAYGFDGSVFSSINLETGRRNWKAGRYGKGQVLLLQDSAELLVAGEHGEIVLLRADPKKPEELARFQALTGKTWNHPVIVGDRLYVRNSQEAAAFRLPLKKSASITDVNASDHFHH